MSISSTTNRNDYVGNGAASTYAYGFKVFLSSELLVTVVDTSGDETTLVLNTDYSVTGAGSSSGGNVVLIDASQAWLTSGFLTSGYGLTVRRVRALTQLADIRNQGDFYPETHEDVFDKQVMNSQQQQDELDRTLKLPETEAGSSSFVLPPLVTRANQFLGFDSSGDPVAGATFQSGVTASAFMQTMLDDTTAAAARTTLGIDGASGVIALGDLAAAILAKLSPSGAVSDYAGATAPTGWVLCDGTSYDSTNPLYSALFTAIGSAWNTFNGQSAPGGALFRAPKLAGMATIGAGAAQVGTVATTVRALGAVLGAESVTISQANLPAVSLSISGATGAGSLHTHTVNDPGHIHGNKAINGSTSGGTTQALQYEDGDNTITYRAGYFGDVASSVTGVFIDSESAHTHSVSGTTSTLGSGSALANMQPSAVMNKIIKL